MDGITQAGAVPYRVAADGQLEVLLVTGGRRGKWTIPKGGIKVGASPEQTAAAEALEEAGVMGRLEEAVGTFAFLKAGERHAARVFALRVQRVLERWDEEDRRLRAWVPIGEVGRFVRREAVVRLVLTLHYRRLAPPLVLAS